MKPTIGRIVHVHLPDDVYSSGSLTPHAAVITKVWNDSCLNVTVFKPDGSTEPRTSVTYSDSPMEMNWSWPPKV